jgi:hypothetical protein
VVLQQQVVLLVRRFVGAVLRQPGLCLLLRQAVVGIGCHWLIHERVPNLEPPYPAAILPLGGTVATVCPPGLVGATFRVMLEQANRLLNALITWATARAWPACCW